jgi:NTP pyrophosphatase (non-canonical NTP hydrolase)
VNIADAQKLVWENKVAKGFDKSDVPTEFCYIQGELAEAFEAWRTKSESLSEELADVMIYVLGLATMTNIDLAEAVREKIAKNAKRRYVTDPHTGSHLRVYDGD